MTRNSPINFRLQGKAVAVGAVGCGVLSLVMRGGFGHVLLCLFGAAAIGVMVVAFLSVAVLGPLLRRCGRRGWRVGATAWNTFLAAGLIGGGLVLSFIPGTILGLWEVSSVKNWCVQCVPAIERHRTAHGAYPEKLSDVEDLPSTPLFGSERVHWHSGEDGYGFDVYSGFISGWTWNSRSQCWYWYD
jgi:hypothetical protein